MATAPSKTAGKASPAKKPSTYELPEAISPPISQNRTSCRKKKKQDRSGPWRLGRLVTKYL